MECLFCHTDFDEWDETADYDSEVGLYHRPECGKMMFYGDDFWTVKNLFTPETSDGVLIEAVSYWHSNKLFQCRRAILYHRLKLRYKASPIPPARR